MKLSEAAKYLKEIDDEDRGRVPPISGGGTISTKQAAKELGVTVSRVRQMLGGGGEKKHLDKADGSTEPGSRDNEIKLKDVQQLKKNKPKKGRPAKKGASKDSDDDKD